jgi:hypothetical protein
MKLIIQGYDVTLLVIIIPPCVVFLCFLYSIYYFIRYGVESRYQSGRILGSLKYLNEYVFIRERPVNHQKILTKREKRKVRIRRFLSERDSPEEGTVEEDDGEQLGSNFLSTFLRSAKLFSSKDNDPNRPSSKSGFWSWLLSRKVEETKDGTGSSKKGRFVSQDRLQRVEARKLLIKTKSAKIYDIENKEEEKTENVLSLLDLEAQQTEFQKEFIKRRQEERKNQKEKLAADNPSYVDVVKINSGPPSSDIPEGYRMVDAIYDVNPDTLLSRRILYLWEGDDAKAKGWFIGTVATETKQKGFNYNIKYDRKETGTLFVDGFETVLLSLSGNEAYGRKWILLEKIHKKEKHLKNYHIKK